MKNGGKNKSVAFIILFSVKCPTNFLQPQKLDNNIYLIYVYTNTYV